MKSTRSLKESFCFRSWNQFTQDMCNSYRDQNVTFFQRALKKSEKSQLPRNLRLEARGLWQVLYSLSLSLREPQYNYNTYYIKLDIIDLYLMPHSATDKEFVSLNRETSPSLRSKNLLFFVNVNVETLMLSVFY